MPERSSVLRRLPLRLSNNGVGVEGCTSFFLLVQTDDIFAGEQSYRKTINRWDKLHHIHNGPRRECGFGLFVRSGGFFILALYLGVFFDTLFVRKKRQ